MAAKKTMFSKFVAASLLGIACFFSPAMARPEKATEKSSSECPAVSIARADLSTEQAIAEAAASAAAYVCGETVNAEESAYATASAFAYAMAEVTATCKNSGDSSGSAYGYAKAEVEATVWLEAYAAAMAAAIVCGDKCESFVDSFTYVGKDVFLKALAETEASVSAYSNDPIEKVKQVYSVKTDIEEAIVTAYAYALANARAVHDVHGCYAYGSSTGCIYTEEDPYGTCAHCHVESVGYSDIVEIDAIAEASASAVAWTCGGEAVSIATATSTAKALAEAHAIATSYIYASCWTDEHGYACASADSYVEETAYAVAEALANAWAAGITCEGCLILLEQVKESIGVILVKASSAAWGHICVNDGDYWTVDFFVQHITSGYVEALAEACALAVAVSPDGDCYAAVDATALTEGYIA